MKKFCLACCLAVLLSVLTFTAAFAHPGPDDVNGGHEDNENISGGGSYHYHHGYRAHSHLDGVCPYAPVRVQQFAQGELPAEAQFKYMFGLSSIDEVQRGVILYNDGRSAEMTLAETKTLLEHLWNFDMERDIRPYSISNWRSYYINIYTADKKLALFPTSIMYGSFGEGNYVWYSTYVGNARQIIASTSQELYDKYLQLAVESGETPAMPSRDCLKLPQHEWAVPEIQDAAKNNILTYDLAKDYETPITRENFCVLIVRVLCEIEAGKNEPSFRSHDLRWSSPLKDLVNEKFGDNDIKKVDFVDGPTTYLSRMGELTALDIIEGRSDGTFDPNGNITREEAAKILCRTANVYLDVPPSGLTFADNSEIADWAKDYVSWVSANNIMYGTEDRIFDPKGTYTTEQAIATTLRLLNLIKNRGNL